jgi:hypothetical protein
MIKKIGTPGPWRLLRVPRISRSTGLVTAWVTGTGSFEGSRPGRIVFRIRDLLLRLRVCPVPYRASLRLREVTLALNVRVPVEACRGHGGMPVER